jgi:hypothetical protein
VAINLNFKVDTSNVQMIAPVQEQPVVPLPPPAADKKTNDKKKGKKEATPEPPVVVNFFSKYFKRSIS